ncbi:MAG: FKBP-type peptidyl-prolyl cis-trans isomerase [Flavobacteriales bacterium]
MSKPSFFLVLMLYMLSSLSSCESKTAVQNPIESKPKPNTFDDSKLVNKAYIAYEDAAIDTLIQLKKWDMEKSGTGLRYQIENNCENPPAKEGSRILIELEILDIYDNIIFKKQEQHIYYLKDYTIKGLEEALSMMCLGSKAKLIVPSHLAYGLRGYQDDIAPKQVLIYQFKIKKLIP